MRPITMRQLEFLEHVRYWTDRAGFPECVGGLAKGHQRRTADCLQARGLIEFSAFGHELDGDTDREDLPIYKITQAGRDLLQAAEVPSPATTDR